MSKRLQAEKSKIMDDEILTRHTPWESLFFERAGAIKILIINWKITVGILLILALGSVLRLQGVFTQSFAFTYDVGRDMLALANIIRTHKIPLIGFTTGLPGVFYGPWWYLFLLGPYFLVGGNPVGVAGFMAFTGIVTILFSFFVGWKISSPKLGIIFALLSSISPALISSSSQIWNPNIAPLFVSAVFIVLISMYESRNFSWKYPCMLGLLLGFLFDIEIVFGTLFFISTVIFLILFLRRRFRFMQILGFILGLTGMFSPRIFFELRHHFLMTKTIIASLMQSTPHATNILSQFFQRVKFFINLWADSLSGHNVALAIFMILFSIVSSFVFYQKVSKREQMLLLMQWVILGVYVLGLTFFSHDIWPHYTVGIPLVYVFLFGLCLYFWVRLPKTKMIALVIGVLLIWVNISPLQMIIAFQKPIFTGDASVYRNQIAVIDYVYRQANREKFKYVVYTPPVYDYTYQYLFSWYGKRTYRYVPEEKYAHLFFVIMEPDKEEPSRLTDWMKMRRGDGVIVKSQTMPSGIIIQTRIVNEDR